MKPMMSSKRVSLLNYLLLIVFTSSCLYDHRPAQPNYNLDVTLRGSGKASGFVKFQQFTDSPFTIFLDTSVQGLDPSTNYGLQRAVDTNLDGNCSSSSWLTLGKGLQAQAILTDTQGGGIAALFRYVSAFSSGTTFDIHFQVINLQTSVVVLTSDCYQYTVK